LGLLWDHLGHPNGVAVSPSAAKRAREINDKLPVIYMTGANAHEWGSRGVPNSQLVPKPFAVAQVVTSVSQLINAAANLA
jgi:hypothetical protein